MADNNKKSVYDQWLEDYKKTKQYTLDFDRWLEDFEETDRYQGLTVRYNNDWRKIYDEMFDIFHNE